MDAPPEYWRRKFGPAPADTAEYRSADDLAFPALLVGLAVGLFTGSGLTVFVAWVVYHG